MATLKPPENALTLLQTPPKTCNSDTVTALCFLGEQELINHRLARVFETFEHFAPLHFQAPFFFSAPIKGRFSVVPPSFTTLQMHSSQRKEKKRNTSFALSAASRCENKPMARRKEEEEGRGKKGGRGEVCYAPVKAVRFRPWLLHVAEAH